MRTSSRILLAAVVILSGSAACFAEQMDNPQYTAWSKFKPGTSVTRKTSTEMAGQKMETQMTTTLVEVTPDKAVIENKMSMGGTEMPGQKMDVPAKIEKPAAPAGDAPKAQVKESSETVDVAGKKVNCKVTESTMDIMGKSTVSRVWTSDEVPGQMVKSESKPADGSAGGTTTMVADMTIK